MQSKYIGSLTFNSKIGDFEIGVPVCLQTIMLQTIFFNIASKEIAPKLLELISKKMQTA